MIKITHSSRARSGLLLSIQATLLIAAMVSAAFASLPAQEKSQQQSRPDSTASNRSSSASGGDRGGDRSGAAIIVTGEEDYRIGVHDLLDIQVENAPELTREFRVTASGAFLMPYVGRVAAKGKTPEEVADYITTHLRGEYLKDPKVIVRVKEYNSRAFFIQGAVRNPNVYQIEGKPSLLEIITLAGGLAENHGSVAYVIRKIKQTESPAAAPTDAQSENRTGGEPFAGSDSGPRYEMQSVNIGGLLRGHFDKDVFLEPGDIVNIPATDIFFVAGEVNEPGSFPLKEGTTLRQAIALAQGTKFNAATSRGIIFRENLSTGKREELRVDIGDIMGGKKEDVTIMANDIIIVPNSRGKTIGGALLRAFGISTITRVPVY
jgi:polysaccharide export outer membrane protein